MAKINILTKDVFNQISAGEVVERPSSIVKELFENSIDAGATAISVEIENGGINLISVEDNGCGIENDQLEKVFYPHATSKISKASDLQTILTLGFRGEAMSSIASVSKINLISKTADSEIGYFINVEGGEIVEKGEIPCENGTKITVSGIFFNTPARLKFLKSAKSEENEITSLIEKLILANPTVAVKYVANGKLIYQSYGDGLKNALIAVYGKKTADNCIEFSIVKNGIKMEGFLGKINFTKSNKSYQTLIVNGRCVSDTTVQSAIGSVYKIYLMKRQYPFYVFCMTCPPEIIDVNVHPRKTEIRFQDNGVIYSTVNSIVSKVVENSSEVVEITSDFRFLYDEYQTDKVEINDENVNFETGEVSFDTFKQVSQSILDSTVDVVETTPKKYLDENLKEVYLPYDVKPYPQKKAQSINDHVIYADFSNPDYLKKCEADDIFAENKRYLQEQEELKSATEQEMDIELEMEFISSIFDTYVIFEYGKNILLVDQHAAHERLVYDKLLREMEERKVVRQQLLMPYNITVNASEFDMVYDLIDYLRQMGIDIDFYDNTSFRIYALPDELFDMNVEKFIFDILSDNSFKTEKVPQVIKEKLMQKACKSAIKAGYRLKAIEIDSLICELKKNLGLKCPHGRPVAIKISKTEIDKWFKRIV